MENDPKRCFITVGTTSFDLLMRQLGTEAFQTLVNLGYTYISVQYGRGEAPVIPTVDAFDKVTIELFDFKPNLAAEQRAASLIICHGGLGSLMEALSWKTKRVCCVVNESLMNNHQLEIALELGEKNSYVYHCVPETLSATLRDARWESRTPLPSATPEAYVHMIDQLMFSK